jgi:mannosyltransferase
MPDVDESKVRVIYNGISENFHVLHEKDDSSELPFPSKSYIVFIGRRDEYKNFDIAVKALAKTKWNLLIIGSQLNAKEQKFMNSLLPEERYKCVSNIHDDVLNLYYNHAAALLYPSSYEGFGLPVLEAQRAGCPVIAYNASSIPEIIGDTPLLMKELTVKELTDKIRLLNDSALTESIRNEGVKNAQRFSWDKMAREYQEIYHDMYHGGQK